jgi:sulfite reductase (NADPH) hemoprotein beta-component
MPKVVTANDLRTGVVVYLGNEGQWTVSLAEAEVAADAEALKRLEARALAAVQAREVTAVYAMDVALTDGRPQPVSVRERIRAAHAPTV